MFLYWASFNSEVDDHISESKIDQTILPYLGFPLSLKNVFFSITGLGIIYLCYLLYRDLKVGETGKKTFDNFSENKDFTKTEQ